MAFNLKALTNIITFRHEVLTLLSQVVGGASSGNTDALLADIKDAIDAIAPLIDGLELITGNIKIDTASVNLNIDQVEGLLNATNELLLALETRTRPLVWIKTHIVDVGDSYNPGSFSFGEDPARRAVRITNNSGDALGRQAACAFVAFNGSVPDLIEFVQVCAPGQSILLDSPQAVVEVRFAGNGATVGTVSIVEYQ